MFFWAFWQKLLYSVMWLRKKKIIAVNKMFSVGTEGFTSL